MLFSLQVISQSQSEELLVKSWIITQKGDRENRIYPWMWKTVRSENYFLSHQINSWFIHQLSLCLLFFIHRWSSSCLFLSAILRDFPVSYHALTLEVVVITSKTYVSCLFSFYNVTKGSMTERMRERQVIIAQEKHDRGKRWRQRGEEEEEDRWGGEGLEGV